MNDELIPCTVELERLKIFLGVWRQLKKNVKARRFFPDEYYADLPPYTIKELMQPSKRFLEMNKRIRLENMQGWIDAIKGGPFPKV